MRIRLKTLHEALLEAGLLNGKQLNEMGDKDPKSVNKRDAQKLDPNKYVTKGKYKGKPREWYNKNILNHESEIESDSNVEDSDGTARQKTVRAYAQKLMSGENKKYNKKFLNKGLKKLGFTKKEIANVVKYIKNEKMPNMHKLHDDIWVIHFTKTGGDGTAKVRGEFDVKTGRFVSINDTH